MRRAPAHPELPRAPDGRRGDGGGGALAKFRGVRSDVKAARCVLVRPSRRPASYRSNMIGQGHRSGLPGRCGGRPRPTQGTQVVMHAGGAVRGITSARPARRSQGLAKPRCFERLAPPRLPSGQPPDGTPRKRGCTQNRSCPEARG